MSSLGTFLKSIPSTFYSRSFYVRLIYKTKGIGLDFMLFQAVLAMGSFFLLLPLLPHAQATINDVFSRLPEVTLRDQKLSIDQPSPYVVSIGDHIPQQNAIVFDTTTRPFDVRDIEKDMQDHHMLALVTADFIALHKRDAVEIHSFSDYKTLATDSFTVGHDKWVSLGNKILLWGVPIIVVSMFIFFFIFELVATVFRAIVAKFLAVCLMIKPDFSALMRLSAAAAVPISVFSFFIVQTELLTGHKPAHTLPFFGGLLIWAGFAIYGLYAAKKSINEGASSDLLK